MKKKTNKYHKVVYTEHLFLRYAHEHILANMECSCLFIGFTCMQTEKHSLTSIYMWTYSLLHISISLWYGSQINFDNNQPNFNKVQTT